MRKACLGLLLLVLVSFVWAQGPPRLAGVEPVKGKAGATVTATGENLGKSQVVAVFLSDANSDYKVAVVEQTAEKIVFRVPAVKADTYNVSLQVRSEIFIQPVRFTVE